MGRSQRRAWPALTSATLLTVIQPANSSDVTWVPGGFGGDEEPEASAQVRAIQIFLAQGGERSCNVPRVDFAKTARASLQARLRGKTPFILTNALKIALDKWDRESFLHSYGGYRVKTNNGWFDHIRTKETTFVEEYVQRNQSLSQVFLADHAYALGFDVLLAALGGNLVARQSFLADFDARHIFSLGVRGSLTRDHRHAETWQYALAGRKAWWVGDRTARAAVPLDGDPCLALPAVIASLQSGDAALKTLHFCVSKPGELIYFGDQSPHATCNLDSFVLGFGAQGTSRTWQPLHRAVHQNNSEELRALLSDPSVELDARDATNQTALHRSVGGWNSLAMQLLVEAGADIALPDAEGKHALTLAAERGNLGAVRYLLEAGAPLQQGDSSGAQPIHWASLSGHAAILVHLLGQLADLRAKDGKGTEPLHWAAMETDPSIVRFLLARRADARASSKEGTQPMHWAAGVGHAKIADLLVKARAEVHPQDTRGSTPLHFASAQDRLHVVNRLLAAGADPHTSSAGNGLVRPSHLAAAMGHARCLDALVSSEVTSGRGSLLEATDVAGRQPAHLAAASGHISVLRALAQWRANLLARASNGDTALDLARRHGQGNTVKMLSQLVGRLSSAPRLERKRRSRRKWHKEL